MMTSESLVELQSFVRDKVLRSVLIGIGCALLVYPIAHFSGSLSLLYGVAIGILNSYLLAIWVSGLQGKDEKQAKRAVRGSMVVRFTCIATAVSLGAWLAEMNILAFIFGFFIIQVLGTVDTYKENQKLY